MSNTPNMALTIKQINAARPCAEGSKRVSELLRAYNPDKNAAYTATDARAAGCTFEDVLWIASAEAKKDPAIERAIRMWLADCAARVLHIYERDYPNDLRPRNAIKAARDFANGKIDDAARDAARAAAWAAAWAAARAPARDAEEEWQFTRLCAWLSEKQPRPLALRGAK